MRRRLTLCVLFLLGSPAVPPPKTIVVRPREIDDLLVNPGVGITTFNTFNGPSPEPGLPPRSVAYFRLYWRQLEPEAGKYRWEVIDDALRSAREHGQTLMVRLAPHSSSDPDVPAWYRALVGDHQRKLPVKKWLVDPEDPRFAERYGGLIRAFGARYDGHVDLESVDLAIVGAWGEGAGSNRLSDRARRALVDCYTETFKKTPLVALLMDARTHEYVSSKGPVGWRADCLGDMGGFRAGWSHMLDRYPESVLRYGLEDAWKKAPVNFEVCWVMQHWKEKGWDIDAIIDQSLRWHISSLNAKNSPVPEEWRPAMRRWLQRMGYRFVLRKLTYPAVIAAGAKLEFTSLWENKGVAPCYHPFPLALRLERGETSAVLKTGADIRSWLPGDFLYDGEVEVPQIPAGEYDLSIAILDLEGRAPHVRLAIAGVDAKGWYPLGKLKIRGK